MKYSKAIVKDICDKIATGDHRIIDVCDMVGISETTFYHWKETKSEFSEALKKAEAKRLEAFKFMAKSGLAKLLDVHEYEEVTSEYALPKKGGPDAKPTLVYQKRIKKKIMPNPTAVIFALTNMDPDNFKHKQDITTNGKSIELPPIIGMRIINTPSEDEDDRS